MSDRKNNKCFVAGIRYASDPAFLIHKLGSNGFQKYSFPVFVYYFDRKIHFKTRLIET